MTDRDTFAAAALTGLLSDPQNHWPTAMQWECLLKHAYTWADAMLAARGTTSDHDAAPAAKANAESVAPLPTATDGSGNPTSHGTGDISTPGLTSVEQFVLLEVRDRYADEDDIKSNEIAFVLDAILTRLGGGK